MEEYVDHVACIPHVGYPEKMIENLELEEHMGNEVITLPKMMDIILTNMMCQNH